MNENETFYPDWEEFEWEEVELDRLGMRLPIGIVSEGERLRNYALETYLGKHEVALGRLEDQYWESADKISRIYPQFLLKVVESIEGYSCTDVASKMKCSPAQVFDRMFLADTLATILSVRMVGNGRDIGLAAECPCEQRVKIRPGEDGAGFHDLGSVVIRELSNEFNSPFFSVKLSDRSIVIHPPLFQDISRLNGTKVGYQDLSASTRLTLVCSDLAEADYINLSRRDRNLLKQATAKVAGFGPDKIIEMDCPSCGKVWDVPLAIGVNYEEFYATLLAAPRLKSKIGSTEEYFNKVIFFLSHGDQAPVKDPDQVYKMTPNSREFMVRELKSSYEKQAEESKKAQAKAKSRR